MKQAGAGGLGISAVLAGCTGGGGDGGDGGDGGSSDGSGGQTTQKKLKQVNMTLPGDGFQGVMLNWTRESGLLDDEFAQRGYKLNIQDTWEGSALFAAGGPDFETMSSLEGARLGVERQIHVAEFGRVAPMFMGWWVKKGGPYDPANTGSAQATLDKVVEDGANVGIGSWAGGDVPAYTMAVKSKFGYDFKENGGDFQTVTADYNAIPKLILEDHLAIGGTSPIHGVSLYVENGEPQHTQVFSGAATLKEQGLGVPPLNNLTTNQAIIDDDKGAAEALIRTWHQGMQWLLKDPMGRLMEDKKNLDLVGVETKAQAQYLVDWGVTLKLDNEYPYNYLDQEYTDELIKSDTTFLNKAVDAGFLSDGWDQYLTLNKIPQS